MARARWSVPGRPDPVACPGGVVGVLTGGEDHDLAVSALGELRRAPR